MDKEISVPVRQSSSATRPPRHAGDNGDELPRRAPWRNPTFTLDAKTFLNHSHDPTLAGRYKVRVRGQGQTSGQITGRDRKGLIHHCLKSPNTNSPLAAEIRVRSSGVTPPSEVLKTPVAPFPGFAIRRRDGAAWNDPGSPAYESTA